MPAAVLAILTALLFSASCDSLLTSNDEESGGSLAVVVGVSQYRVPSFNLRYADDDALDFFDALIRGSNWDPGDITVLLNGSATKSAVASAISSAGSQMSSGDKFVFFFSGHGTFGPDFPPKDEADGRDEFLIPHDALSNSHANDISDDELESWLASLPTSNVLVVLDSSFSGGPDRRLRVDGKFKFIDRGITVPPARGLDGMTKDLARSGYIVQTARAANESPLESNLLRNGVYTYYLVEGLLGPANPDSRFITAQQGFDYAAPRASAFFPGMHPRMSDSHGKPYNLIQQ